MERWEEWRRRKTRVKRMRKKTDQRKNDQHLLIVIHLLKIKIKELLE